MTNQLSAVIGVVAGVVVGVVAGVVVGVSVELCLRLWKLNDVRVTATSVSISMPCSGALAALASLLPPMGRFGGILIH